LARSVVSRLVRNPFLVPSPFLLQFLVPVLPRTRIR